MNVKEIKSLWLSSSDYEAADLPGIYYTNHNRTYENAYSEIWMTVKKKGNENLN
ncbi:hypothetical protein [Bacillus dakarensis]|uniref:hypothetical protein n=1 Tax=Robertmurraya dakarensis TaxID=1926278 RepID=UPI0012B69F91|nr:hypothetical protein [Bacillus dakarensis]